MIFAILFFGKIEAKDLSCAIEGFCCGFEGLP